MDLGAVHMSGFGNLIVRLLFGLVFVVLATSGPAAAKDVALTQDNVSRFLASFAEMREIAIREGLKTGTGSEAAKNPVAAVIKAIRSSKLKTEAKAIAVNHGFADIKDWTETGRAIGHAYLSAKGGGPAQGLAKATLDKNKDNAIKQLEKLGLLDEKQKQKLKENLNGVSEQLSREPPPENVAVVRQMMPDIEAAVKLDLN
jgi:hypothetical protein